MSTPVPQSRDEDALSVATSRSGSPLTFFVLVFALSIPFWVLYAWTRLQLTPTIPVSALMMFCPLMAASILVYRRSGIRGVRALLQRSFDYRRIKARVWYAPILLFMPSVLILAYGLKHLTGVQLPIPHIEVAAAAAMLVAFFFAALAEELGWSGYAIDSLQARWSALGASLLLGAVWALWHVVAYIQTDADPVWLAWWSLFTVASRVIMVWIYNNTGKSVFAMALYHAVLNLSNSLVGNDGLHPYMTAPIVAVAVIFVAMDGVRKR
jgi:membrane protease YdiL (CAAX protease family)